MKLEKLLDDFRRLVAERHEQPQLPGDDFRNEAKRLQAVDPACQKIRRVRAAGGSSPASV